MADEKVNEKDKQIGEKVKQIIVEQLGVDEGEVTSSASFVDDLGADSLDTVELVMAFEEGFDIEIPDEDAETMAAPTDLVVSAPAPEILRTVGAELVHAAVAVRSLVLPSV